MPRKVDPAKALRSLALDMEEPLNDAADYVLALRLIGEGLIAIDDNNGRAIVTTAWAATKRLNDLRQTWDRMFPDRD